MVGDKQHRIAFAYHNPNWIFGEDKREDLEKAEQVTPAEYRHEMRGAIFCPECTTPLSRAPEEKELFTNSRTAHFRHRKAFKHIACSLRVSRGAGLQYHSEEEVKRAVQNENLVLVGGWAEHPPEILIDETLEDFEFRQTQIVDPDGPITEIPLGRHTGKKVLLPTRITSVLSICRGFDKNIHRAFFLPDSQYALHLRDLLYDVARLDEMDLPQRPNLYFGRIERYARLTFRNIIYLKVQNFPELKIYTYPTFDERKRIDQGSIGRVMLFYGAISSAGEGIPRFKTENWGEYSLLPSQYEKFLPWS
ncbi:hypothetical protein [Massilia endophytica]|uniref:hypothetical protein n=1 Tax=Massilia endophytica TaxID=2899220 RepID=UPI001E4E75B8|nr:hypothetical protein [Massilia endophytica]UGQ46237.1 hypothetical protein LSQ66_21100 [Massilia endophytica]